MSKDTICELLAASASGTDNHDLLERAARYIDALHDIIKRSCNVQDGKSPEQQGLIEVIHLAPRRGKR